MPDQTRSDYLALFDGEKRAKALALAHDIRKFEIDLYWKRGAYFWTIIAVVFAGYFLMRSKPSGDFLDLYVVTLLGFSFSLCWYFVNRGSGAWQRNWEAHVDLLEDEETGPLYKTVLNRNQFHLADVADAYAFSPSRINNVLSLLVTAVWLALLVRTVFDDTLLRSVDTCLRIALAAAPMAIVLVVFSLGKTIPGNDPRPLHYRTREYS